MTPQELLNAEVEIENRTPLARQVADDNKYNYDTAALTYTFHEQVANALKARKNDSGFLMLNAMFATIIITISMFALLQLTLWVKRATVEYTHLIKTKAVLEYCGASQSGCEGTAVFCLFDASNAKELRVCRDSDCAFVDGNWEHDGTVCTEGVLFR